jgi:oxygen-independent coproporphyrinogen-3 oxidase
VSGVYISWPFCSQKCTFCNFASGVRPADIETRYRAALFAELSATHWDFTPETVYLGGGTPSLIPTVELAALLEAVPGRPWREATIECAPGGLTEEKVRAWRAIGIDRVSLGVQSFVDSELRRTGRRHDAGLVQREIEVLRRGGIDNFNIDLIAGLPAQTRESWDESLDWIERLEPPHVSVYMFEVDRDSRLGNEIILGGTRYGAGDVPSEEMTAEFYETAATRLAGLGIARYEISNFARPGWESAHNLKYWRRERYLGFGADAHSFDGSMRWQNAEDAADYIEQRHAPEKSLSREAEEKFFLGLRLAAGVQIGASDWQRKGATFDRFLADGLLQQRGEWISLTPRGILYSNEVFQEFLEP